LPDLLFCRILHIDFIQLVGDRISVFMKFWAIHIFLYCAVAFAAPDSLMQKSVAPDTLLQKKAHPDSLTSQKYIPDSTKAKKIIDTTRFVLPRVFYNNNSCISDSTFLWNDYRYAADVLSLFPATFDRSLGTLGQHEELLIYGRGYNNESVFQDGLLLNDRTSNNFDFNYIQVESTDSIEIASLPRGFLYGPKNNPVSINVIPSSKAVTMPYSRIKFYQAPNGEAMLDARFNQRVYKKAQLSFDITNRKIDQSYENSDYSLWGVKAGLMVPLNNSTTLFTNFQHDRMVTGLYGGVNVDSTASQYADVNSAVYSPVQAFPNYAYRYEKQHQNTVSVMLNSAYKNNAFTSLRLYFRDNLTEYRENEYNQDASKQRIVFNRASKTEGISLRQDLNLPIGSLNAFGGYEYSKVNDFYSFYRPQASTLYAGASFNMALFDSSVVPSVFAKYLNISGTAYKGAGADIQYNITDKLNFYAGYSSFEKQREFIYDPDKNNMQNAELKLRAAYPLYRFEWTAFYSHGNKLADSSVEVYANDESGKIFVNANDEPVTGMGISFSTRFAFLQLESSVSYQKSTMNNKTVKTVPEFSGNAGLFYRGVHFDTSLVIKAGLQAKFFTGFTPLQYDYFYTRTYYSSSVQAVKANCILNIVVVGEIKKAALVYFTYDNLLGAQYYLTPIYPAFGRGMRFGLSWELWN
jgi:outer membrane cobalamin receptor